MDLLNDLHSLLQSVIILALVKTFSQLYDRKILILRMTFLKFLKLLHQNAVHLVVQTVLRTTLSLIQLTVSVVVLMELLHLVTITEHGPVLITLKSDNKQVC
jgi:hypothetical protein